MALIPVPKPSKSSWNPDRPISSLLQWQVEHLYEAENRLPLRHQTNIYANTIRTEGEASVYIRAVTEAIHKAHAEAEAQRTARLAPRRRKRVIELAAVADEKAERKHEAKSKPKKSKPKKAKSTTSKRKKPRSS